MHMRSQFVQTPLSAIEDDDMRKGSVADCEDLESSQCAHVSAIAVICQKGEVSECLRSQFVQALATSPLAAESVELVNSQAEAGGVADPGGGGLVADGCEEQTALEYVDCEDDDEESEQAEASPSVMDAVYEAMVSFGSRKWALISVLSAFVQCKFQVGEERVSQAIEAWLIVRVFLRKWKSQVYDSGVG